jgi:hypothetical protein
MFSYHAPRDASKDSGLVGVWRHSKGHDITVNADHQGYLVVVNPVISKEGKRLLPVAFLNGGYFGHRAELKKDAIAWSNGSTWTRRTLPDCSSEFILGQQCGDHSAKHPKQAMSNAKEEEARSLAEALTRSLALAARSANPADLRASLAAAEGAKAQGVDLHPGRLAAARAVLGELERRDLDIEDDSEEAQWQALLAGIKPATSIDRAATEHVRGSPKRQHDADSLDSASVQCARDSRKRQHDVDSTDSAPTKHVRESRTRRHDVDDVFDELREPVIDNAHDRHCWGPEPLAHKVICEAEPLKPVSGSKSGFDAVSDGSATVSCKTQPLKPARSSKSGFDATSDGSTTASSVPQRPKHSKLLRFQSSALRFSGQGPKLRRPLHFTNVTGSRVAFKVKSTCHECYFVLPRCYGTLAPGASTELSVVCMPRRLQRRPNVPQRIVVKAVAVSPDEEVSRQTLPRIMEEGSVEEHRLAVSVSVKATAGPCN